MDAVATAGLSNYGLLATLTGDTNTIQTRLDTLTDQASTGSVSTTYAGLGSSASISLDLNPEIANLKTWQSNINAATGVMGVAQTAMTQIQQIASNLYSQLDGLQGTDGSEVDSIAASARDALSEVAGLLDTTDGNTYVFGGADSSNPPVPDPDDITSSGFYTQIAAAVGNLGTAGADATASATLNIASSDATGTTPFSAYMSQSAATLQAEQPVVQTGQGQTTPIALLASANSAVTSSGSSTTGSYMRDLLRALATVGSLSSSQQSDAGFDDLVQDTRTSLNGAISAMASDAGVLGNRHSALTATQTELSDTQTALTTQLSGVQDVDMATTLSNISLVQTELQASYQMIETVSSLSLAKFLAA
jgi:flagellin-like hook-associated protein FlgL